MDNHRRRSHRGNGEIATGCESFQRGLTLATEINSKQDIVNARGPCSRIHRRWPWKKVKGDPQQLRTLFGPNSNRLDALDVVFAQGRIAAATRDYSDAKRLFREVERDSASQTSMRLGAEHELALLYEYEGDVAGPHDVPDCSDNIRVGSR